MGELPPDLAQYLDAAADLPGWTRDAVTTLRLVLDQPLTADQYERVTHALAVHAGRVSRAASDSGESA